MIVNIFDKLINTEKIIFIDKITENENYISYRTENDKPRHYLNLRITFNKEHLDFRFYEKNNKSDKISDQFKKLVNNIRNEILTSYNENEIVYLTTSKLIDHESN